ncbi:MAG: hypothetical protein N3C60_08215 [Calditerrivibrio sp.]|nr:hypothetical protein [Calditerrivibrio sp.]
MKKLLTLMAVVVIAATVFVTGCQKKEEPAPAPVKQAPADNATKPADNAAAPTDNAAKPADNTTPAADNATKK